MPLVALANGDLQVLELLGDMQAPLALRCSGVPVPTKVKQPNGDPFMFCMQMVSAVEQQTFA